MKELKQTANAFNMVEISIVISLLVITVLACLPVIFNNTKEAKIISAWKQLYAETKSNFEIYSINDQESVQKICDLDMSEESREKEIYKIIKPYLNVDTDGTQGTLKGYRFKFSSGSQIPMKSIYFFRNFEYQEGGNITGFKWLTCSCDNLTPCAAAVFDMNGKQGPNRLGQDVFGIYIYENGLKPFGSELSNSELDKECVKNRGTGAVCSEFYLRGGKF